VLGLDKRYDEKRYYRNLERQERMKINETIAGKRDKIIKRIIELSQEEAKHDGKRYQTLKSSNSTRKIFKDLDPELISLFPKSFLRRDSEVSIDALKPSQFHSLQKYKKRIMRQATVLSPTKRIGTLEEANIPAPPKSVRNF
jgi:hypothetical protein